MGPLAGVRVLDLSRLLPGPACTWYLRGLGAGIDRVEVPKTGDFTRHVPPYVDGVGALFAAYGAGKRSLAVDLRKPEGRALIRRLLPRYDALVEGFKPGVLEEMGLDPADLLRENPGLVVARISGFGQTGPWSDRPAHDVNYVGLTGSVAASPHVGDAPALPPVQVADLSGALVAAMGIAAALFARERTGQGRVLDVSLAESALSFTAPYVLGASAEGRDPTPGGEVLTGGAPIYGTYRCADDRYLTLGALEPKFQLELAANVGAVGREELARAFRERPRDEWVERLASACAGPALSMREVGDHPHWLARGAVERIGATTWVRPPLSVEALGGHVPGIGEHTDDVLAEAGVDAAERAGLRARAVVG